MTALKSLKHLAKLINKTGPKMSHASLLHCTKTLLAMLIETVAAIEEADPKC